jgi:mono/diheme cytochrome c family protein
MKTFLKILAGIVILLLVVVAGVYLWAGSATNRLMSQTYATHTVDFPIPFPLDPEEVKTLGLTEEAARQMAIDRAVERGKHLITARYPCTACHSDNFGGGTMVDAFPIGKLLAPNVTTGPGSRTLQYKASDWDRIVRHGVLPDNLPAVMPSEDFLEMSDQELSDIVSYIRSLPPVSNTVPRRTFGPLGKFLVATGELPMAAFHIDHTKAHKSAPPSATASAEFGKHIAGTCVGCHRTDYSGGPIVGGDPAWPPARNITPAPGALQSWSYEQFTTLINEGKRPDGAAIKEPMTFVLPYLQKATETERQALWAFLQTLPPVPVTQN